MKATKDIGGWFNYEDVFDILIKSVSKGGIFIEGGAWLGKSSSYLCDQVAKLRPDIQVFILDTWEGSPNERDTFQKLVKTENVYAMFISNMGTRKFTPIRKESVLAAQDFADNSVDVMFIDMEHTFEAVVRDIKAWFPKVKEGGYIAGHDYGSGWPDVVKAVQSQFDKKIITAKSGCWMVKKTKGLKLRGTK